MESRDLPSSLLFPDQAASKSFPGMCVTKETDININLFLVSTVEEKGEYAVCALLVEITGLKEMFVL